MKNKWFEDVFLTSLFEKTGVNRDKWLTVKQTAICTKYMERHSSKIQVSAFDHYNHDHYTYTWLDRDVFLDYSKKNGCGLIRFGMNPKEIEISNTEHQKEREQIEHDRAKRSYTKHRDRYDAFITRLKDKISYWQEYKQECINENDLEGNENIDTEITKLNNQLLIWLSVQ